MGCLCVAQRFGPLDTLVPFSRMFEDMMVPAAERAGKQVIALRAKRNVDQRNIEEEEVRARGGHDGAATLLWPPEANLCAAVAVDTCTATSANNRGVAAACGEPDSPASSVQPLQRATRAYTPRCCSFAWGAAPVLWRCARPRASLTVHACVAR